MGKIAHEDIVYSNSILMNYPGSFIGGSYVVNRETANDIDIIVPYLSGSTAISTEWEHTAVEVDNETKELYDGAYELVNTYRKGNVNILLIDLRFYAAYWVAVETMKNRPDAFSTRDNRVELHVKLKEKIKKWIEVASNA